MNDEYSRELIDRLWHYRATTFRDEDHLFERVDPDPSRPPVFVKAHADRNVLVDPRGSPSEHAQVRRLLRPERRHRWFRSMRSSQALAQGVFGNLQVVGKLHHLAYLGGDDHESAFFDQTGTPPTLELDHPVAKDRFGERQSTSVDVWLSGPRRVAIECKLSEAEVGPCSRPRLNEEHRKYCSGAYQVQPPREERCSLTSDGIAYWTYGPKLFTWAAAGDHACCPLNESYQLVRNILAACVDEDRRVDDSHHVLLLYDDRNPAFGAGGAGFRAYDAVKGALRRPAVLRRCSWQRVIGRLARDPDLAWLVSALGAKYGLVAG